MMELDALFRALPKADREAVDSAPLFIISELIATASEEVSELWRINAQGTPHIILPATARLPAKRAVLYVVGKDFLAFCAEHEGEVLVASTPQGGGGWRSVGGYIPGGRAYVDGSHGKELAPAKATFLVLVAHLLMLINTPTYTLSRPPLRQQRRAHARSFGQSSAERIRVIEWDLTKPKLAAGESVGSGRHMPLHYTRGHWRKCEAHHKGAVEHDDGALRQWIEGFWSGHPAYGTIKSVYAPTLGG